MRIVILSRGSHLYSTQSLIEAGRARGHEIKIVDLTRLSFVIDDNGNSQILNEGVPLESYDAVIPRIGSSVTQLGASVIRQFELVGTYSLLKSSALLQSRDKLRCSQKLAQVKIPVPKTVWLGYDQDIPAIVNKLGGYPVIVKLLEGTHGNGVLLLDNLTALRSIMNLLMKKGERTIMQEFIEESDGADFRAFVVGDKVVASMKRQAAAGEFRSNLHRGATATPLVLTEEEQEMAVQATKALSLEVAGVDILRSNRGPLIMEINASPGLEGIETSTGIDIAFQIMLHLEQQLVKLKNYSFPSPQNKVS